MIKFIKYSFLTIMGISALSVTACGIGEPLRSEVAMRVASPAWMVKRPVEAEPFILTAFERMHEPGEIATLYIEGNGEADLFEGGRLFDPTPHNPVALHLASKDKADNLAYLARPCQYTGLIDIEAECETYWGDAQFSETVLSSYNKALDGIKARYDVTEFNLIGYNGGATLAAMLAANRSDVASLRTVAGLFDMDALSSSLSTLRGIPQHHFIGGQDELSTSPELHDYLQALGSTECAAHTLVQEAEHEKGWVDKWPELLKAKAPRCFVPQEPAFVPIEKPEPIYAPRMGGIKK